MQNSTLHAQPVIIAGNLFKAFHSVNAQYQFKPIVRSVYFYLLDTFTSLGCQQQFWHSDLATAAGAGCSLNTMKKAREVLVAAGLIHHTAGGYGHASKTMYTINTNILQTSPTPVIPFESYQSGHQSSCQPMTPNASPSYQNLTPLYNSPALEKKTGEEAAPPCTQAALFEEPSAANVPTHEEIERAICALAETDFGRELVPADMDVLRKIEHKWLAACEQKNWRYADGSSIAAKWKSSLKGYFATCVDDVRASREKLKAAEIIAANTQKNQQQREEYYAERRVEKARYHAKCEEERQADRKERNTSYSQNLSTFTQGKNNENRTTSVGKNGGKPQSNYERRLSLTTRDVADSAVNNPWFWGNADSSAQSNPYAV